MQGLQTLRQVLRALLFLLASALALPARAEEPAADPGWFDPAGIRGSLVLCGGRIPDAARDEFVKRAGGREARLIVIPTAGGDTAEADGAAVAEIFKGRGIESIRVLHTANKAEANTPEFVAPLKDATAVWFTGGLQTFIERSYLHTLVEDELHALLARGGVVGGTSAGAACMSRIMLGRDWHRPGGLGLMPGSIIDQHFLARNRRDRLQNALIRHPTLVGLGIDEGAGLIVEGRSLRCVGDSTVTVCYAATARCSAEEFVLKAGQRSDLTMLRRAAYDRTQMAFPPPEAPPPAVPHGSLVIVGGGGLTEEITQRFITLAGGPDALIVVLPIANADVLPPEPGDGKFLERAGAKNVHLLTARRREEVESPGFLDVLRQATGVWFGGGRQWRFVDAYEGTKAFSLFHDVLRRGGVIGGSSAGATIQGDYLVRGSPLGNEQMMCPGYERGLAFLPGVAIDQHFTQRKRFADMTSVMAVHPQLLGIGLDESTAIVVQKSTAEVLGKGHVHFYDRRKPVVEGQPDYEAFAAGARYDLAARKAIAAD